MMTRFERIKAFRDANDEAGDAKFLALADEAGITIEDNAFIELAHKFIRATKWRGGCELEIMQTTDGKSYIMEVNPRFPAWIYLSAAAGQNQPAALVKMALGEPVEPFINYEVGKMFIRYSWDLITDVTEFQKISGTGEL